MCNWVISGRPSNNSLKRGPSREIVMQRPEIKVPLAGYNNEVEKCYRL